MGPSTTKKLAFSKVKGSSNLPMRPPQRALQSGTGQPIRAMVDGRRWWMVGVRCNRNYGKSDNPRDSDLSDEEVVCRCSESCSEKGETTTRGVHHNLNLDTTCSTFPFSSISLQAQVLVMPYNDDLYIMFLLPTFYARISRMR